MVKWSDYGIPRVKYSADHSAIVGVEIRPDLGENFGEAQNVTRTDVISAIERGSTFGTVYTRDGKYVKGEDVRVITIHGQKYIRTDNNSTKADNLGTLPEYV